MRAEQVAGLQFGECCLHDRGEQFGTQAGRMCGATLRRHPLKEGDAIPLEAVLVEAGIGTVDRHVAALDLAGRVAGGVGADDTPPARAVAVRGQVPGLGEPRQHVVRAVVVKVDAVRGGGVRLGGRDT